MTAENAPPRIEILLVGMNGDLRGKQIPLEAEKKVWEGTVRLPSSTQSLDIWGDDNDDITGLSLSIGDPDGVCIPDRRSLAPRPWAPDGSLIGQSKKITFRAACGKARRASLARATITW